MSCEKVRRVYPVFVAVVQSFEIIISVVQLPTDFILDVLLVRFPLGVIPKLHTGELPEVHRVALVVLFGPLFGGECIILCLLLLLVASIAAAMVISFPPVRTCSSGVFVFPLPKSGSSCCPAW